MRINHNIPALRALHQLTMNNSKLSKSLERLSSGLRINHASDDAAGLAITQKMDTQIRGLGQAKRNTMDGVSLIQTAEGAMNEVHAMLQRMRELAVQASNGTYDGSDRDSIQKEINQLNDEIKRISNQVEFNEKKLLNGDIDQKAYASDPSKLAIVSLSDTVGPDDYEIKITQVATRATITGTPVATGLSDITAAQAGKVSINGEDIQINEGDTPEQVFSKLRDLAEKVGATVKSYRQATPVTDPAIIETPYTTGATFMKLEFQMKEYGTDYPIEIKSDNVALLTKLAVSATTESGVDAAATFQTPGTPVGFTSSTSFSGKGQMITVKDANGFEMKLDALATGDITISVLDAGALTLQIGANEGQSMDIRIPNLSPKALGIDNLNLATTAGAQLALGKISEAINKVSSVRSKLGAYQNRLEHTVNNLGVASESMTEAMSRILDADMAYEMAQYTQRNVIAQAGTSMLAQANQRPQSILQLLQG